MSRDEFQFHDGGQREARQFFSPIHFVPSSSLENIQRSCNGNYLRRKKRVVSPSSLKTRSIKELCGAKWYFFFETGAIMGVA